MNLILVKEFPPRAGGIAQVSLGLTKALNDLGEKSYLVTWYWKLRDDQEFDRKQEFSIFRLRKWNSLHLSLIEMLFFSIYLVKKFKITKIFTTNWNHTGLIACLLKKIFNIPYFVIVHAGEIRLENLGWRDKRYMYFTLKNADKIFAVSRYSRQLLINLGFPENKCVFMPNAVDSDIFNPCIDTTKLKTRFAVGGKKIILSVGRLEKVKGLDMIIKALPEVIKKVPELYYLIIGEGREEDYLKNLVRDLQLGNYVKFLGFIPYYLLPQYYNLCDVFILASRQIRCKNESSNEAFGIVYIEASACAKPVIAGNSGGVKDAVIDRVTGILINPEDIKEITVALVNLLTDGELAQKLGKNGRRRIEQELNWTNIAKQINQIANKEIANKKGDPLD